jgi:GTP cyclohydrolase II
MTSATLLADHGAARATPVTSCAASTDTDAALQRLSSARLPTVHGEFVAHVYRSADGVEHMALVKGDVAGKPDVLARLHSECLTGDVFGSLRCDCGEQLAHALDMIEAEGFGVLVYLRGHEGRGIGLVNKIRAYALQDQGHDTVDANRELGLPIDARRYDAGIGILRDLRVASVRLMSNNPRKVAALAASGIPVTERVPLAIAPNPENEKYLAAKRTRMGHLLG